MTQCIWKFELKITEEQEISMPMYAEILCVQCQNEVGCLWAMVNPQNEKENRIIIIRGTGHMFEKDPLKKYIGTFHISKGALVWHVFEKVK